MVEAHRPEGEGSGQQAHMREKHADGILKGGQLLQNRRRLDQLPVGLRLLNLWGGASEEFMSAGEGFSLKQLGNSRNSLGFLMCSLDKILQLHLGRILV